MIIMVMRYWIRMFDSSDAANDYSNGGVCAFDSDCDDNMMMILPFLHFLLQLHINSIRYDGTSMYTRLFPFSIQLILTSVPWCLSNNRYRYYHQNPFLPNANYSYCRVTYIQSIIHQMLFCPYPHYAFHHPGILYTLAFSLYSNTYTFLFIMLDRYTPAIYLSAHAYHISTFSIFSLLSPSSSLDNGNSCVFSLAVHLYSAENVRFFFNSHFPHCYRPPQTRLRIATSTTHDAH